MICRNCGKNVEKDIKFCPYCGNKLNVKSKKKKIICFLLLLTLVGAMLICLKAGLQLPGKVNDDTGLHILKERFTNKKIRNGEDAAEAASEKSQSLGYKNAMKELRALNISIAGNEIYYRMQQTYKGIPVYGKYVVVIASDSGEALELLTDVKDVPENLNLIPDVSEEEILSSIKYYFSHVEGGLFRESEDLECSEDKLIIYDGDEENEACLAYLFTVDLTDQYEIVVDAHTAEILEARRNVSDLMGENEDGTMQVPVVYDGTSDEYFIYDENKNIYLWNLKKKNGGNKINEAQSVTSQDTIFGNTAEEKKQNPEVAFALMTRVERMTDYYKEKFGGDTPFDALAVCYNDGRDGGANAFGGQRELSSGSKIGLLSIGYKFTGEEDMVIAHEYTHIIQQENDAATGNSKETEAISEGMADAFAGFYTSEWDLDLTKAGGTHRNAADPSEYNYPEKISDKNKSGENYAHGYATVISHMAYLMEKSGRFSKEELQLLWYKTMLRLPKECTYLNFRSCMEQAARVSRYSEVQKKVIADAFENAGISFDKIQNFGNDIQLAIYDKEGNTYDDYTIKIEGKTSGLFGMGGKIYTDEIVVSDSDSLMIHLEDGNYTIVIEDHANKNCYKNDVKVKSSYTGTILYVQDLGAEYTVAPDAEFQFLDITGDELEKFNTSIDADVMLDFSEHKVNLSEKNYYKIVLEKEKNEDTYYDVFTVRVKEGAAKALVHRTNLPSDMDEKEESEVYTESELHDIFTDSVNRENELYFIYDDYDNDGICEAYGITGVEVQDFYLCEDVKIYYISSRGKVSCVNEQYELYGYPREQEDNLLLDTGTDKFLVWEETAGGPGFESTSYLFGVIDGEYAIPDISEKYRWFGKVSEQDGIYMGDKICFGNEAQECLRYYFTYDENEHQFIINDTLNPQAAYLEDLPIIEKDQYMGNEGDSFVDVIGKNAFTRGNTDINGNSYEHGIEAWIARWNYDAELSWAYSVFELGGQYDILTGTVVLIDSFNTTNFNSTLEIYGDDKLLLSYELSPESIPFNMEVNVSGVNRLKIYVYDNVAAEGGTSFGLTDMYLVSALE